MTDTLPAPAAAWPAPEAAGPLAADVALPGSKSLTARALVLAAIADAPTTLTGVLRSRDTDLMIAALTTLGARFEEVDGDPTHLTVVPATLHVVTSAGGAARIDCGLAGTVMRFIPPLAVLADAPVVLDGDPAARARPLAPLLDVLTALGAGVQYLGEPGHLPVRLTPVAAAATPDDGAAPLAPRRLAVDASGSSQFLSALLLTACLHPGGLAVTPTGPVPSLPHVTMTVGFLRGRGLTVQEPVPAAAEGARTWTVGPGRPCGGAVAIEPDLSNAGPFLAGALVAGGTVRVQSWPATTTQPGDAWRELLPRLGGRTRLLPQGDGTVALEASGTGTLTGIDADLSAVGELAPTVAALAVLASAQGHSSRLTGIAHLRGHETNRLAALVTEITRLGGRARETADGLDVAALAPGEHLHAADLDSYADHRMATFGALVGLGVPGVRVRDVACTAKTLPAFTRMWEDMLAATTTADTAAATAAPVTAPGEGRGEPGPAVSPDDRHPATWDGGKA